VPSVIFFDSVTVQKVQAAQIAVVVTVAEFLFGAGQQVHQAVFDAVGGIGDDRDIETLAAQRVQEFQRSKSPLLDEFPQDDPVDIWILLQDLRRTSEHDQCPDLSLGVMISQGAERRGKQERISDPRQTENQDLPNLLILP